VEKNEKVLSCAGEKKEINPERWFVKSLLENFLCAWAVKDRGGAWSCSEIENCPSGEWGHAVAQLVEALSYKPEHCKFDSWRCHNPSGRTTSLGSNQPLAEMSTRNMSWG
jgi:hypothetical protein